MKAFVVAKYGADGLVAADVPVPDVGLRDLLIDVRAASVNPLDTMVRNGEFKQLLRYERPFTLGHDVAGVVIATGSSVTTFAVGDRVFARPRDLRIGTFAEYVAVDEADAAPMPSTLTFEEAAAVPLVALAAWQALVDVAGLKPGDKVLIHAGAGGLGSTAIQVAKYLGAHVATTASTNDVERVKNLGADDVIDYTRQDFATELSGYDVVLDSLGGSNLEKSLTVLRRGGLVISVVGPPTPQFAAQLGKPALAPVMGFMSRKIRKQARALGVQFRFLFMAANGAQLEKIGALYESGDLKPVLDRTFTFDETLAAIAFVEQGKAKGKVVISRSRN